MKKIQIRGKIFSSKGEGKKFIALPWVKKQIEDKLGFTPFAGTLNLRLFESGVQKKLLAEAVFFEVCPEQGFCKGTLIRARFEGLDCAIIIPNVQNYPEDVLEIIAPVDMRDSFRFA
jgi:riboflavin kinase